jgi:hypothetical protein
VTDRIRTGVAAGEFDDNARMARMDVIFANRYLDAAARFDAAAPTTAAWAVSFDAGSAWPPIVLQHLFLGMNAHINLDLGIAAAEVAPGQALPSFQGDFFRINTILASLVGGVKDDLVAIWPLLGLLERAVGTTDDAVVNFSMGKARAAAWEFAQQLAALPTDRHAAAIAEKDAEVATFGRFLRQPGWVVEAPLLLVRASERGTVPSKIDRLVN